MENTRENAAKSSERNGAMEVQKEKDYEMAVSRLANTDIESPVYLIRGQKVMLEQDVARLYEVETRTLIRAVRRHVENFPVDFLFKLTPEEFKALQSQKAQEEHFDRNHSTPYAFTEAGVAMVSQVLNSARALQVNVAIIRDFVRLRKLCGGNLQLSDKLDAMNARYDQQLKNILGAIEALQGQMKPTDRRVGFYVH